MFSKNKFRLRIKINKILIYFSNSLVMFVLISDLHYYNYDNKIVYII